MSTDTRDNDGWGVMLAGMAAFLFWMAIGFGIPVVFLLLVLKFIGWLI